MKFILMPSQFHISNPTISDMCWKWSWSRFHFYDIEVASCAHKNEHYYNTSFWDISFTHTKKTIIERLGWDEKIGSRARTRKLAMEVKVKKLVSYKTDWCPLDPEISLSDFVFTLPNIVDWKRKTCNVQLFGQLKWQKMTKYAAVSENPIPFLARKCHFLLLSKLEVTTC